MIPELEALAYLPAQDQYLALLSLIRIASPRWLQAYGRALAEQDLERQRRERWAAAAPDLLAA